MPPHLRLIPSHLLTNNNKLKKQITPPQQQQLMSTVMNFPSNLVPSESRPPWLSPSDTAWQQTAATLVGLQSVPGLIVLYGCMVKKKWAINSAFMALYAFAAVLLSWVLWAHQMSFGDSSNSIPILSQPKTSLKEKFLSSESEDGMFAMAAFVFFQFAFAAITVILLAGSLLGRMNFFAWMVFVPLWVTGSYTVGAYTIWGESGWLKGMGLVDFAGGYVIHLSSGIAGFTAAYWVGPRLAQDRQNFPPNNIIHMLGGAGLLWLGWTGFNGGAACSANVTTSLAVLNTHLCTATSLFIWQSLDMIVYKKSSVIGAVQGMITGLVCITPAAGVVEPWAAMVMGVTSGSLPWYTMMVLHKRSSFFQKVDDTLGAFHTHAVAGTLGGLLAGLLSHPRLIRLQYDPHPNVYNPQYYGLIYCIGKSEGDFHKALRQFGVQVIGAVFIATWNVVVTSIICVGISRFVSLRMDDEDLKVGDDAVHGEEAYAIWGDGGRSGGGFVRRSMTPKIPAFCGGGRSKD